MRPELRRDFDNYLAEQRLANLKAALHAIQEEMDLIARQLAGDLEQRCRVLKRNGCVVEAIKQWRNERGCSLREAKDAVESLGLNATDSPMTTAPAQNATDVQTETP